MGIKEKVLKTLTRVPRSKVITMDPDEVESLRKRKIFFINSLSYKIALDFIEAQHQKVANVPFVEVVSNKIEADLLTGKLTVTIEYTVPEDKVNIFIDDLKTEALNVVDAAKSIFGKAKKKVRKFVEDADNLAEQTIEKGFVKGEELRGKAEERLDELHEKATTKAEEILEKAEVIANKAEEAIHQKSEQFAETAVEFIEKGEQLLEDALKPGGKVDQVKSFFGGIFERATRTARQPDAAVNQEEEKSENREVKFPEASSEAPAPKRRGRAKGSKNKPKDVEQKIKKQTKK